MKILQVIPYFVPAWDYGGPLTSVYNISKQLIARGHDVTVYTTDTLNATSRTDKQEENIDGISVKRFKNLSNVLAYHYNIFLSLGIISEIRKEINGYDMIHLHEYRTIQNLAVYRQVKKHNIPYVLQARGSLPRIMTKQGLKKIFDRLWGYTLLRDATKVIALTEMEVEQYRSMGANEDKIVIIPNGIDTTEFDDLPDKGEFRNVWGIGDQQKIVLFLGRIHRIKGPDLLARAFSGITNKMNDTRLVIAGPDDGYLSSLKKLVLELQIDDKVIFTGSLYGRDKLAAYVDADVYVLPSSYEIFGLTILEACACGTPVIVTDRCGIAEAINNQAGISVPFDQGALGNAILDILGDDNKKQEFSRKGRLLVRETFDWEKISAQIEDVYQQCLAR